MAEGKVEVLLSAFNGAKYIEVQVKSILKQSFTDLKVSLRDDGSEDSTSEILAEYEASYSNVFLAQGSNIGVVRSFLRLLKNVCPRVEYVAFSDQDDIWHPTKIETALQYLSKCEDKPAMYCGNANLVNELGDFMGFADSAEKIPSFSNAIIQNIAPGCTMVLNRPAINLLNSVEPDFDKIIMHDWWFYLVVSAFGRTGRFLNRDKDRIRQQVHEFVNLYGDRIDLNSYLIATDFLNASGSRNIFKRIWYVLRTPSYRHSAVDNLIYKILFVFGFS